MSVEAPRQFVDANILIYACDRSHKSHAKARCREENNLQLRDIAPSREAKS